MGLYWGGIIIRNLRVCYWDFTRSFFFCQNCANMMMNYSFRLAQTTCNYCIEDITCPRVDTNVIFECSSRYLTSERSERVTHRVEHSKIKFVSTSRHVICCLLYKQQYQGYFSNFPKISEDFRRVLKIFEDRPKFIRTFPIIFRKIPKMSEDVRRLPKAAEYFRANFEEHQFRSYRNEFRFVQPLNFVNLIAHTTSLLSSHVKISNLPSHVKISCFHSKRNPCNSLKFHIIKQKYYTK